MGGIDCSWGKVETRQSLKVADVPGELSAAGSIVALSAPFERTAYIGRQARQARSKPAATTMSGRISIWRKPVGLARSGAERSVDWTGLSVHLVGFPGAGTVGCVYQVRPKGWTGSGRVCETDPADGGVDGCKTGNYKSEVTKKGNKSSFDDGWGVWVMIVKRCNDDDDDVDDDDDMCVIPNKG